MYVNFHQTWHAYSWRPERDFRNVYHAQVLVMVLPIAQKLSKTEEWCQDTSCLFQRVYYRNKG